MPGDLFSTKGEAYWKVAGEGMVVGEDGQLSIGEKVYIRTNNPLPESELDVIVYRITIEVSE